MHRFTEILQSCAKHVFYIGFVNYAVNLICACYTGIMLNAFATYYAHNYAGIIGSGLLCIMHICS